MRNYIENRKRAAEEAGLEYTGDGYETTVGNEEDDVLRSEVASVANEFWEDFERRSRHDVRAKKGRPASQLPPDFVFDEKSEELKESEDVILKALKADDGPPVLQNYGKMTARRDVPSKMLLDIEKDYYAKHMEKLRIAYRTERSIFLREIKERFSHMIIRRMQEVSIAYEDEVMGLLRQFEGLKAENAEKDCEIERLKRSIAMQEGLVSELRSFIASNDLEEMKNPEEKDRLNEDAELHEPTLEEANQYLANKEGQKYYKKLLREHPVYQGAEKLLAQPFAYYGGYLQLSKHTRERVMESELVRCYKGRVMMMFDQLQINDFELGSLR